MNDGRSGKETYVVRESSDQIRIDRFLSTRFTARSRTAWQRAIRDGLVTVNGKPVKANYVLEPGDRVDAAMFPAAESQVDWGQWLPASEDLIVYRDQWLIVVNKPRGLVVHPAKGHWNDTLIHRLRPWLETPAEETLRPGVVHRLDRDTTGLLVVARSEKIRRMLSEAIQKREVHRFYAAVIHGALSPQSGVIEAPVGRDPRNRLRMAVILNGREARTHYRMVAEWSGFSLVQLTLETGRTHQIRVHLASIGHPVAGDTLYGGQSIPGLAGQALHAGRIRFIHPMSGELLCLEAPLPEDWAALARITGKVSVREDNMYPVDAGCSTLPTEQVLRSFLGTTDRIKWRP